MAGNVFLRSPLSVGNAAMRIRTWECSRADASKKYNKITAISQLLDMLGLKGCVVTADALNCQKTVAAKVREKKADHILAVNGNHPQMHDEIKRYMDDMASGTPCGFESVEKDHGRMETRRCWQTEEIGWFADTRQWAGLRSFCLVEAIREYHGRRESSRRYSISSLGCEESRVAHGIRSHWRIENSLHWSLDVVRGSKPSASPPCRQESRYAPGDLPEFGQTYSRRTKYEIQALPSRSQQRIPPDGTENLDASALQSRAFCAWTFLVLSAIFFDSDSNSRHGGRPKPPARLLGFPCIFMVIKERYFSCPGRNIYVISAL